MKYPSFFTRAVGAFCAGLALTASLAAASYDKMVVFGDSLSDNGNLSAVAGTSALTSQNYDPFRITDGPTTTPASSITGVTVEQLNKLLNLPTLTPAIAGGNNYAWAFATTAANLPDFNNRITPGTGTQVATYLGANPAADPNALYVVWAGSNDLLDAQTPADIQTAEKTAITNLTAQISGLLASGAKNILWLNLPDLGLTPGGFLEGPALDTQLRASSLDFRNDWTASIAQLQALFPTASITGFDTYSAMLGIFSNPLAFGLSNVTTPAILDPNSNPDQALFWDTIHPTTKADSILANEIFQQLAAASPVPEPSTGAYVGTILFLVVAQRAYSSRRKRQKANPVA